jgi:hypothetical protein
MILPQKVRGGVAVGPGFNLHADWYNVNVLFTAQKIFGSLRQGS